MDFNDTPEQAAFREAAASWLAANVPSKEEIKGLNRLEVAKLWQKRKYDAAGLASVGIPLTGVAVRPPLNKSFGSRKRVSTMSPPVSL